MKKTILFFTENHLQGGGNKYFVDLINSIPSGTNAHILTNKNGFFDVDRKRLKVAVEENVLFVFNSLFLSRFAQYKIAERIGHLVAPFVFLLNYCWFLIVLVRSKPALVVSNNGGYPGAESTLAMIA